MQDAPKMRRFYSAVALLSLAKAGGEGGIRTHGTQKVQRFSRPPRSAAPAPLQKLLKTKHRELDIPH